MNEGLDYCGILSVLALADWISMAEIRVVFPDDGVKVRLTVASESDQLVALAHRRRPGMDPVRDAWLLDIGGYFGSEAKRVMFLSSSLLQFGLHFTPSQVARDINQSLPALEELDRTLSLPTRQVRQYLQEASNLLGHARGKYAAIIVDDLARGLSMIHSDISQLYSETLGWRQHPLKAASTRALDLYATKLATLGLDRFLQSLTPQCRWRRPVLSITNFNDECHPLCPHRKCHPFCLHSGGPHNHSDWTIHTFSVGRDGLTISINLFAASVGIAPVPTGLGGPILSVPPPPEVMYPLWLVRRDVSSSQSLSAIIGASRSWVFECIARTPSSTSQIARQVGLSMASASEHATALRAAGWIKSVRDRGSIIHSATDIGYAVLAAATQD